MDRERLRDIVRVVLRVLDEGGGTLTHDLGIKSPLLYQLSYAPELNETSSCGIAYTR